MLFSYISPVSTENHLKIMLHLSTMCNLSTVYFIPQLGGILHFDLIRLLPIPGYAFHSHTPPKIHLTEVPHLLYTTPSQNCFKSPHNSINHFDNHFDTPPKYPLTTTHNKLSDNYIIHQKLPKSGKNTPPPHSLTTHSQPQSTPKSSLNQAFKQTSPHHKSTSKIRLDTELTSKPYYLHKNNPIKIRPECKIPVLNHIL